MVILCPPCVCVFMCVWICTERKSGTQHTFPSWYEADNREASTATKACVCLVCASSVSFRQGVLYLAHEEFNPIARTAVTLLSAEGKRRLTIPPEDEQRVAARRRARNRWHLAL